MAKLAPKYVGPYDMLEKKGPNTYLLMDQDGDIEDLVHAENLKPYFAEKEPEDDNPTPENEEDDNARPPGDLQERRRATRHLQESDRQRALRPTRPRLA